MKTPEQMAEEYALKQAGKDTAMERHYAAQDFLAGFRAGVEASAEIILTNVERLRTGPDYATENVVRAMLECRAEEIRALLQPTEEGGWENGQ